MSVESLKFLNLSKCQAPRRAGGSGRQLKMRQAGLHLKRPEAIEELLSAFQILDVVQKPLSHIVRIESALRGTVHRLPKYEANRLARDGRGPARRNAHIGHNFSVSQSTLP